MSGEHGTMAIGKAAEITILHFNDCYNVEEQKEEPVGGATRFSSALKSFAHFDPLILFSGDILAPSIMSTFTKGEQMAPVLNTFKTHCAVYGNHDFDFGVDNLIDFAKKCNFPWLLSNVVDNETGKLLADGLDYVILERSGKKIGLIGLVEEEWLATLATIDPEDVTYKDFVTEGRRLARMLKSKMHVDYVIALTHMRFPNDCRLADNVDEIDLILGGHDHVYEVRRENGKYLIKSGTDFRQMSRITVSFEGFSEGTVDPPKTEVRVDCVNVTSQFEEDEEMKDKLEKYKDIVQGKMDEVLVDFAVDLDGRFCSIRTKETNLGNFICDVMLSSTHSDLAILNSGTLRSDKIHPKGPFTMRDLVTILPMMDSLIVLSATGKQILVALENGVSQFPKLEGRFPQVSGVCFCFDPEKPPGSRINPKHVKIGDEPLDLNQSYRLVTKSYMHLGRDGYDVLKDCQVLLEADESPELCTAVQNHFEAIKVLTGNTPRQHTHHRQSLVCLSRRHSIVRMAEEGIHAGGGGVAAVAAVVAPGGIVKPAPPTRGMSLDPTHALIASSRRAQYAHHSRIQTSLDDVEHAQCRLEPRVEGRIVVLTPEILKRLEASHEEVHPLSLFEEVIKEEEETVQNGSLDKPFPS